MLGRHTCRQPVKPLRLVQVAAGQGQLGLHDIGSELVGVQPGGLVQRGTRFIGLPAAHQHARACQVEFGVFRGQRDGAVDAGQRRFGLAALQLGG